MEDVDAENVMIVVAIVNVIVIVMIAVAIVNVTMMMINAVSGNFL
ncbi:hypothetical protein Bmyc01_30840 [Bacillus mycoides]|nr:hypothetical protein Bmyc01_30840 [Bacillus mycoides]